MLVVPAGIDRVHRWVVNADRDLRVNDIESSVVVGWTEHIDPATNYPYWTNDETGESTWHKP